MGELADIRHSGIVVEGGSRCAYDPFRWESQRPRFGGAFFTDADALHAFKSRGFGGEIGVN